MTTIPHPGDFCRADEALVRVGLAESRSQAQRLIKEGQATADGKPIDKPGRLIGPEAELLLTATPRYVSRGGDKLAALLDACPLINPQDAVALDIGASTGGWTDCLLQRDAAHVTCVDVGHGQLHPRLQGNTRVHSIEGVNARDLATADLPYEHYDIVVIDVSFISLRFILPAAWERLREGGHLVALIKPQFEVPRALAAKTKGIIKDSKTQQQVLEAITAFALTQLPHALHLTSLTSPIKGTDGNQEYLIALQKTQ